MDSYNYLPSVIDKKSCVGNTLSTINISLSTLDNVLFNLSIYTSASVNGLSASQDALALACNIFSGQLYTDIYTASTALYGDIYSDLSTQIYVASSILTTYTYANSANIQTLFGQTVSNLNTIHAVSANAPSFTQNTIYQLPNGIINYDPTISGPNVKVQLSANGFLANPTNLANGHFGKIVLLSSPTTGLSLTGYGNQWAFSNFTSGMSIGLNARNMIDYYFDASPTPKVLATMNRY